MRKFHRRRDLKEQQPECVINEYVEFDKKLKQKIKWKLIIHKICFGSIISGVFVTVIWLVYLLQIGRASCRERV